jgi:protein phosphatase
MSLVLRFAAGSHKGMIREGNEDSGYAGPRLLAVADGMGGQAAGEVASSEVLSTIVSLDEQPADADPLGALQQAAERANERLRLLIQEDPSLEGMGTTLTALLWTGERAGLIHIGDSRAYLLRDGVLSQITQDHTWVQRLVDEGRITEEEASTHPQRSLIMRALMGTGEVESDLSVREVRAGDRYLLCSDGLSGVVSHQTLEETLGSYYAPEQTVGELIQLALRGGGPDNITCVVADVLDVPEQDLTAGHLADTPVVVGAVADGPPTVAHHVVHNTPASRAASLGRPQPAGPEEAQDEWESWDEYEPEEGGRRARRKAARKRGKLAPALVALVVLAVLGGGAYAGYQWTQSQYYVGANGDHVAIYKGIPQNLAGIGLNQVYQDQPQVALKYLPQFQQTQVKNTISASSLGQAQSTVSGLQQQADVCRLVASLPKQQASSPTPKSSGSPAPSASSSASAHPSTSPTPAAGATLTAQQRQLAQQCPSS